MAIPSSVNARRFYRAAKARYDEALILYNLERTTGAVYLAGYGVECMLKSLVLSGVLSSQEEAVLRLLRGSQAHDFNWLFDLYLTQRERRRGSGIPRFLSDHITNVLTWSTDLRYLPATVNDVEAQKFMESAAQIMQWADGRLS